MPDEDEKKSWPPKPTSLFQIFGEEIEGQIKGDKDNSQALETSWVGCGCLLVLLLGGVCGAVLWKLPWTMAISAMVFFMLLASLALRQSSKLSPFAYMWMRGSTGGPWVRIVQVTVSNPVFEREEEDTCDVELRVPASKKHLLSRYNPGTKIRARGRWQRVPEGSIPKFIAHEHYPIK